MSEETGKELRDGELSPEELDGVSGGKITFRPFWRYIETHGITIYRMMKDGILKPEHVTRLRADHNFTLKMVNTLCTYLSCRVEDIIEYIPDEMEDSSIDRLASEIENCG